MNLFNHNNLSNNITKKTCVNEWRLVSERLMRYHISMRKFDIKYFTKNISVAIGIILIWRGTWIILDMVDNLIFGGNHIITAIGGIIVGILMLYLPEHNLKALERL